MWWLHLSIHYSKMKILGLSCFFHDSAAALIIDGQVVAAAQEERFTRKKHDASFPKQAARYCLDEAGLGLNEIDFIVFFEKPFLKFERLLETYLAFAPRGFRSFTKAIPVWIGEKVFQKKVLTAHLVALGGNEKDILRKMRFSDHHLSHAASAFFPSPFAESVVLTLDGVGEWATASLGYGRGHELVIEKEIRFPHSLGLLYSAFTYFTGFKVNSGEYKLMGLAPYGQPVYSNLIKEKLVEIKDDGSFRLDLKYFDYCTGLTMTNRNFSDLFGLPPRRPDEHLTQKHMDLAASIQEVTEEILIKMCRDIRKNYDSRNLCLAGGVALNCVANGRILREKIFDHIWVQPAAGDAGGALGAALAFYYRQLGVIRQVSSSDQMKGAYLGPQYSQEQAESRLHAIGAKFERLNEDQMLKRAAQDLADGKALGWFQGRMEYGPRALGNRSILADPRSPKMQSVLNLKVKFRESFRPFAPSVLREKLKDWFELEVDSPYMLLVAEVKKEKQTIMTEAEKALFGIDKLNVPRSQIPAVTHIDYSARIQTVHTETNPKYHRLISEFEKLTQCPVLVNTSFNVRGEPIVCTPEDAFRCLMGTDLDVLVVNDCYLVKQQQDPNLVKNYKDIFELD